MTELETRVERHKALGHPVRLRILGLLEGGELCVCRVVAVLQLANSTVSAHLRELRRLGLIDEFRVEMDTTCPRLATAEGPTETVAHSDIQGVGKGRDSPEGCPVLQP